MLCYLFTANQRPTRNRPADEARLQIKYGDVARAREQDNPLGFDLAGVDTTLVLGVNGGRRLFRWTRPAALRSAPHGDHGWVEAGFGKRNPCEWVDRNISAIYWPDPSTHSNDTDRSTKIRPSQIRQPSNPDISSDSTPHLHLIKSHTSVTFRLRRNVTRFRRSERFRWSGGGPFSRDCRGLYARSRCS